MSGYDYVDPITSTSKGQESGTDNCSPLVFDRCDGGNRTRSASGECVDLMDCSAACNGGTGQRSVTLGICTCDKQASVDVVCSQNCRTNAPSVKLIGGTTINMTMKNASSGLASKSVSIDLSKIGDVYGGINCDDSSAQCDIKSTEMSNSGGFYGRYGAPALVETAAKRLRMLEEETGISHRVLFSQEGSEFTRFQEDFKRDLATTQVDYTSQALRNPVVCVAKGDSMLFTIRDPKHYPVYLKDSVMNSNPSFDYGQFLILATQMKTKQAQNSTAVSIFAFTFSVAGSYVFVDASDSEQLMIVRVTGSGEACPDPDRYIQSLSADSAAQSGISQNSNIIIKPDVPLLVGMGSILVLSVIATMVGVGYCLHKGWSLPRVNLRGFRDLYLRTDVDHTCEETFRKGNDFSKFASRLDSDSVKKDDPKTGDPLLDYEDDLDDLNLDIHVDVIQAGEEYLDYFNDKKYKRAREKLKKKSEVLHIMQEIEKLINTIGTDAMLNQMQVYTDEMENAENLGREALNEKRKAAGDVDEAAEEAKKKKMREGWSDRDKALIEKAMEEALSKKKAAMKLLDQNVAGPDDDKAEKGVEAKGMLFEDGAKSRHNQLARQIENDPNLTDAEKEALLRQHY